MAFVLPELLSRYFEATDAHDVERLVALFADTGTLVDAGATRHGLDEIRAWANGPESPTTTEPSSFPPRRSEPSATSSPDASSATSPAASPT
jgi:hypothetical protein